MGKYDSREDNLRHIKRVQELLGCAAADLVQRGVVHDASKLESPEKEVFDEYTPKLKECAYGSDEYNANLRSMSTTLEHHYAHNSHHPEHYERGVRGMDLLDLLEMFFDWKASSERHDAGNIYRSIQYLAEKFKIPEQLVDVLNNTARNSGWKK